MECNDSGQNYLENTIKILKLLKNREVKIMLIQSYIAEVGPIPNEYEKEIKDLLM